MPATTTLPVWLTQKCSPLSENEVSRIRFISFPFPPPFIDILRCLLTVGYAAFFQSKDAVSLVANILDDVARRIPLEHKVRHQMVQFTKVRPGSLKKMGKHRSKKPIYPPPAP